MNRENRPAWRRLALSICISAIVALAILYAADRYLTTMVADEFRTGTRVTTDGDSIGLPLGALAVLLSTLLIAYNVILAILLFRKSRQSPKGASRSAV